MQFKSSILLFLLFSFISLSAFSIKTQLRTSMQESGDTVRFLSWNIYMLPRHFFYTGQVKRAKAIAALLKESKYDVIVFQEAFDRKVRRILRKSLSEHFPYNFGPGKPGITKISSGVWIFSKLQLKNGKVIKYKHCKYLFEDCRARKGAVFVEISKNNRKLQ